MVFDTFTAANSAKGFYSNFDQVIYSNEAEKVYLIKGGPGCGKSTFMKKIATACIKKGMTVEKIHCSSDKDSLDGVFIYEIKTVIIDATKPHSYDTKYPGVLEQIINFSEFWDVEKLKPHKEQIIEITDTISSKYQKIYTLLRAAGNIDMHKTSLLEKNIDTEKITKLIKKQIAQNAILPLAKKPKITNRILSTFSENGIFTFDSTIDKLCEKYIVFNDRIGIGNHFLTKAANIFNKMGYDTLRICNPLLPETKLEQIIIPELSLGFITSSTMFSPQIDQSKIIKEINTKIVLDKDWYSQNKNKLNFSTKLTNEIITSACTDLSEIKFLHDKLEKFYIDATDYQKVNSFTDEFINKI